MYSDKEQKEIEALKATAKMKKFPELSKRAEKKLQKLLKEKSNKK